MSSAHITPTHPSHHPPNSIPTSVEAPHNTPQPSEESVPFTEVVARGKKARNAQSKRVSPQQTTLTFAGVPSPPQASSSLVVSVDIASRVEETKECVAASYRVKQRPADTVTAPAATASITETGRLDQLTSSARAIQHSNSSLSDVRSADTTARAAPDEPLTSSSTRKHATSGPPSPSAALPLPNCAEHENDRMCDITAAAKRARELSNTVSSSASHATPARNGQVHPSRQHHMDCDIGAAGPAPGDSGKEEADPSGGQDKRRRTAPTSQQPTCSTPSSLSSPSPAQQGTAPTLAEYNNMAAHLRTALEELGAMRARLDQLERLLAASTHSGLSPEGSRLPASAPTSVQRGGDTTEFAALLSPAIAAGVSSSLAVRDQPAQSAQPATTVAAARKETAPNPPAAQRSQRAHQYSLAEPKAALLTNLGLPPHSTTDLMLDICLAPLSMKMARGHFPNHSTQPANHRMGIVNLLQGANGVQLHPPRVPLFVTKAHGDSNAIAELQQSYAPVSREYRYLDSILQADRNGDDYDPCRHSFADAECVSTWHQLLTLDTRVVSSQHQRKLHIRLALLNPLLTAAVTTTVAAHMHHVEQSLGASSRTQQGAAGRSGTTSPTPSIASTASSGSSEEVSPVHTSAMDEDKEGPSESGQQSSRLTQGAIHSTVSVLPYRLHYAVCTLSNWPRAHPTELCGSNSHLIAFVRQHAPDVRLVTKEENGMTSASTTAYCQQRHLSQLVGLNGRVSEEHGIHFPLRLHTTIHVLGAKTCTFCWQPNHGAASCPRRASSGNAAQSVPPLPACRQCYSFAHPSAACTSTAATVCTLCQKQGHCTSQCAHFFPSRLPLYQYLNPTPTKQHQEQHRMAADGKGGVPAPILSSSQSTAARPWQVGTPVAATCTPPAAPDTLSPPIRSQQPAPLPSFVTLDQLIAALAPIMLALHQLQSGRLVNEAAFAVLASAPVTASPVHTLL